MIKVKALENVSIRDNDVVYILEVGVEYELPDHIAAALGRSVETLEKQANKPKKGDKMNRGDIQK